MFSDLKIVTGSSNPELAKAICDHLGCQLTPTLATTFSDGELRIEIGDNVRGDDVFVVQPTCSPNVNLIQILSIHMSQSIWKELDLKHELRHNARLIYMSSAKALEIPAQLSDLLNIVKNGQVRINLQENEGRQWRKSIYAIANRLTLSLLSAAMLLASAIFSFTDIQPQILGMPWISFLFLIISGILILYLLIIILLKR